MPGGGGGGSSSACDGGGGGGAHIHHSLEIDAERAERDGCVASRVEDELRPFRP